LTHSRVCGERWRLSREFSSKPLTLWREGCSSTERQLLQLFGLFGRKNRTKSQFGHFFALLQPLIPLCSNKSPKQPFYSRRDNQHNLSFAPNLTHTTPTPPRVTPSSFIVFVGILSVWVSEVFEPIFFLFSRQVPWLRVSKIRRSQKTALNKKSMWFEQVQRKSIPKNGRNRRIYVPPIRESAKVPHRLRQDSHLVERDAPPLLDTHRHAGTDVE
jgi:hypothetical protein